MATEIVAFQPVVLRAPIRTAIGPPFACSTVNRFNGAAETVLVVRPEGKSLHRNGHPDVRMTPWQ
jgi:hypothetical protein